VELAVTGDDAAAALAHIESLDEPRRSAMRRLHELIRATIPDADVRMWDYAGPLIGYGTYTYSSRSGASGDWFSVGLASRKRYVSLFSMGLRDGGHLVEAMHERFPGTTVGRSCLNIPHPETLDDDAVRDLVHETWEQYREGMPPG
jgi:hypothetical protein